MTKERVDSDFEKMVNGYGLTTANILFHIPDYPHLLREFIWQTYDLYPEFPRIRQLLEHWKTLDGPVHSVRVAHSKLIKPAELIKIDGEYRFN